MEGERQKKFAKSFYAIIKDGVVLVIFLSFYLTSWDLAM